MTEESSRELDNPYRGFYQLSGYILSDNQKPEKSAAWCRKSCASNPYPLMLLEINLKNYSNTSISTNAQNQLDKILEEAGFAIRQPGCSACLAMNDDKIPAGKYSVSTSNRNFEGRQGPGSRTLLASPLTAAAAAVTGVITDPRTLM